MHRPKRVLAWGLILAAVAGCVNLNVYVYFDEKKLQDAADRFVLDVRKDVLTNPEGAPSTPKPAEAEPKKSSLLRWEDGGRVLAVLATALVPAAEADAQDEKYVNTDTPSIRKIKERMTERMRKSARYYDAGNLGETNQGGLDLRSSDGMSVKDKGEVRALVRDENADRDELYREVASANGAPESEMAKIRRAFATAFRKRTNQGWWIQTDEGNWVQRGADGDPYR